MQVIIYGNATPTSKAILRQLISESSSYAPSRDRGGQRLIEQRLVSIDSRWHGQIAFIDAWLGSRLIEVARQAARQYVPILHAEGDSLMGLSAQFKCFHKRVDWKLLAPIMIAGMVIDMGIRRELVNTGIIGEQPQDFWIWAFENGTCARNAFGLKIWGNEPAGATLNELWHSTTRRPVSLKINKADIQLLRAITNGDSASQAAHWGSGERQSALKLMFFKLLAKECGCYLASLPVLDESAEQHVTAETSRIAHRIVSEGIGEAVETAAAICLSEVEPRSIDVFKHAFARLLMEHAMDRVLESGLLAPFPLEADYPWGCWLNSQGKEPL